MRWTETTTTSTGNLDDFDFSGADLLRCNNASLLTIRGLLAGVSGQVLTIVSVGAGQVDLSHQDTGDGTAANRLICFATSAKTSLAAGVGVAIVQYDATTARWRLTSHTQGAWIAPAFSAGDYTGNGSMTWTLDSSDVTTCAYYLSGRTLLVTLEVDSSSVGGTPNNTLQRAIPGGFTNAKMTITNCVISDNGSWNSSVVFSSASTTLIRIQNGPAAGNWSASTNNTKTYVQISLEVQ